MRLTEEKEVARLKGLMNIGEGYTTNGLSGPSTLTRLNGPAKSKVSNELQRFMQATYFSPIPLDEIEEILKKHGLILIMEDQTEWEGFFTGADGEAFIHMAHIASGHPGNNDIMTYVPIENSGLKITWHKMGSGRYEVIAYIA